MKHIIIGTAGHVDHGKTMLVKALTGIDTDRLREEKERGISIELGFASLELPGNLQAGIVDVPGHERFIKNMLAGVGGIDMVILVIAADEGIMPQTREHLDIIQLLQVNKGVVAVTKSDLVDDEWMDLVEEDIKEFLAPTPLAAAPLIKVSALTGSGLGELKSALAREAAGLTPRSSAGRARLPVDRVFTVTGFGTVVTGTLLAGRMHIGDQVEIIPDKITSRIRSLQVHGQKSEFAEAGQRVAVNITGVEVEQIERGSVVAAPGILKPSFRLDVKLTLLESAPRPLRQRARVRLYLSTAELLGRVILLDREELKPGETTYVQLRLEKHAVAAKGDRFVIRTYSPMLTIGGGTIIDPAPKKHRLGQKDIIGSLATREKGTPPEIVRQHLELAGAKPVTELDLIKATGYSRDEIISALKALEASREAKGIPADNQNLYVSRAIYDSWKQTLGALLSAYHREHSLREGYPREEIRSRYFHHFSAKLFPALLNEMEREGLIKVYAQTVALPDHLPEPDPELAARLIQLENTFLENLFMPPAWPEACRMYGLDESAGQEVLQYFLRLNKLVKIADNLYLHSEAITRARQSVLDYLKEHGEISIGEARDVLSTSRKFTLPLLEYFDRERTTRRVGDLRVPGRAAEINSK
ncbi:MAG: selenocysteine-specific translation elongation factor [Bacillota bacterium]